MLFEDIDPSHAPRYRLLATHAVLEALPGVGCDAGRVTVHLNNGVRSSLLGVDPNDTEAVRAHYGAVERFTARLASPGSRFEQRMEVGDVWVFDNRRVLHGRTRLSSGRTDGTSSRRRLEGAYVEWDDLDSLSRVLRGAA